MIDEVLGFNPKQKEYEVFMKEITPEMARYILGNYNNDNRKMKKAQVNNITDSIIRDGWLQDGGALTFNIEGNITEFQHRLAAIAIADVTITTPVVLGVTPDCFTKTASPRTRKAEDEIQRKDKTALDSDVTVLREILKRRDGVKLTMQNAVEEWFKWKPVILAGQKIIDGFFDRVPQYSAFKRVFAGWASLMYHVGEKEIADNFLDMLEAEIMDDSISYRLTKDFKDFFMKHSWEMSNVGRADFMYQLLCVCSDRLVKTPSGATQLDLTLDKVNHNSLKNRGFYRKFLENPDGIVPTLVIGD